jgi:hypothetical protein
MSRYYDKCKGLYVSFLIRLSEFIVVHFRDESFVLILCNKYFIIYYVNLIIFVDGECIISHSGAWVRDYSGVIR